MVPIDFVVPMVFDDDPEWRRQYGSYHPGMNHVRWRSWGTEELQIACVKKYMPWVRRIYILLSGEGQVRDWMRKGSPPSPLIQRVESGMRRAPRPLKMVAMTQESIRRGLEWARDVIGRILQNGPEVRVVFHRDFIDERYLPCFTSRTIEMFLHKIPGISEQFIYANDDIFPLSPLAPEDFFRDGLPCQHASEVIYPSSPNLFHRACQFGLNMIAKDYGHHYTGTWLRNGHSLAPILKSTCESVWERHGEDICRYMSPRRRDDKSFNQYLYFYDQYFSGRYVDYVPRRRMAGRNVSILQLCSMIGERDAGILCINDHEGITDWQQRAAAVRRELVSKLSEK